MKKILFIGLVSILFFSCQSSTEVNSPDGTLILRFAQTKDGGIGYRVSRDNNEIIAFSPLGFLTEDQSLGGAPVRV